MSQFSDGEKSDREPATDTRGDLSCGKEWKSKVGEDAPEPTADGAKCDSGTS